MPTRTQNPDTYHFRPDAYASSPDFERGVLGNMVAARCQKLSDPDTATVLWWLQQISWRDGGLVRFAEDFLSANRSLIGTRSMQKFGQRAGQIYNAEQVKQVRGELIGIFGRDHFPLAGEVKLSAAIADQARARLDPDFVPTKRKEHPANYPAADFIEVCAIEPEQLAEELTKMMVNPATTPVEGLWNMPGLWPALKIRREWELSVAQCSLIETKVTEQVFEELDFALQARSFVLIEGREGIGKSHAAENWCAQHAGQAVYARLESGTDESTLFRSVARAIGTACSYGRKATEMRARIQDALQPGQLMLVLDEAHFLWPQSERSARSAPKRMDWLRTALIDFGVPIALISTPQYFSNACDRFRKGGWNSLQIQRRLARTATLPEPHEVPVDDVIKIVERHFPVSDARTRKRIAALAIGSVGFLTTIRHLRERVVFLMSRRPGVAESIIVTEAMRDMGLPEVVATAPSAVAVEPLKGRLSTPPGRVNVPSGSRLSDTARLTLQPEHAPA